MSKLARIVNVCTQLGIDFESVELYSGYKQVFFTLPDSIIDSFRDKDGDYGTESYDKFCSEFEIYYDSEWGCWT